MRELIPGTGTLSEAVAVMHLPAVHGLLELVCRRNVDALKAIEQKSQEFCKQSFVRHSSGDVRGYNVMRGAGGGDEARESSEATGLCWELS